MDIMFRWTPFGIIGHNHGDYFITQGKASRDKEINKYGLFSSWVAISLDWRFTWTRYSGTETADGLFSSPKEDSIINESNQVNGNISLV